MNGGRLRVFLPEHERGVRPATVRSPRFLSSSLVCVRRGPVLLSLCPPTYFGPFNALSWAVPQWSSPGTFAVFCLDFVLDRAAAQTVVSAGTSSFWLLFAQSSWSCRDHSGTEQARPDLSQPVSTLLCPELRVLTHLLDKARPGERPAPSVPSPGHRPPSGRPVPRALCLQGSAVHLWVIGAP